jgi:MinD superfamily P-loop ATPase
VAQVDEAECLGCGECASVCQFEAVSVPLGTAQVNEVSCMGCGVCVEHCPNGALSLVRDASKGEPLEILELIANQNRLTAETTQETTQLVETG